VRTRAGVAAAAEETRGIDLTMRPSSPSGRIDAAREVRAVEVQRRRAMSNAKRTEREIADARKSRLVIAQLEEGTAEEVGAEG
jgi:hypothetical protein